MAIIKYMDLVIYYLNLKNKCEKIFLFQKYVIYLSMLIYCLTKT